VYGSRRIVVMPSLAVAPFRGDAEYRTALRDKDAADSSVGLSAADSTTAALSRLGWNGTTVIPSPNPENTSRVDAAQRCLGLVTARGGSKGLPGKNVRVVGGKPLIAWTLEAAQNAAMLNRVVVSTDDREIAETARRCGAEVPFMRPAELAGDASPHVDVVLHALAWLDEREDYRPDYVVLLQPTSPLRTAEDIDAAVRLAWEKNSDAVVSVCATHDHPYLVRRLTGDGRLEEFVSCPLAYARRQDLPPAYALNGALYVSRPEAIRTAQTMCPAGALAYVMPPERSLQIDSAWELRMADHLLGAAFSRT
jgi:CMP-N,N'-diacetyllegionaminic acid synthase